MLLKSPLHNIPFVRFIIPFVAGIIVQLNFSLPLQVIAVLTGLSILVLAALLIIYKKYIAHSNDWWFGFIFSIFLFFSACTITQLQSYNELPDIEIPAKYRVIATIDKQPVEKDNSVMCIAQCHAVAHTEFTTLDERILIYFEKDSSALDLEYGNRIVFKSLIDSIKNPGNPFEFDFAAFMKSRKVGLQTYINSGNWQVVANNKGNAFIAFAGSIRSYLLQTLNNSYFSEKERSVIAALTLGYKNDLDEATKRSFSTSGAMHILAVSGLHVGIIVIILNILFKPLNRSKTGRIYSTILKLFVLFMFAAISGFSASVIRAVLMFSILQIGLVFSRKINIYNLIAVAAFATLVINPYQLTEVGFQLSYLAVLSIVFIFNKLYPLWEAPNKVLDYIWAIVVVSVAAQIGTSALGMYYFNQFPNWFILTNIAAIPMAMAVVVLSVIYYAVSWIPLLSGIVATILNFVTSTLIVAIKTIENLPFSVLQNIHLSLPQMLMVYGVIISLLIFFTIKRASYFMISLLFIAAIAATILSGNYKEQNTNKLIVYNISGGTAINFIDSKTNMLLTDSITFSDDKKLQFAAKNNWIANGKNKADLLNFTDKQTIKYLANNVNDNVRYYKVGDYRIFKYRSKELVVPVNNRPRFMLSSNKLPVDYVLLRRNAKCKIEQLIQFFDVDTIIADGSNYNKYLKQWKAECKKLNIPFYNIKTNGAFIVHLSGER